MEDSPLLNKIPKAARRIGCGRTKVYELMAAGEIESVKVGRSRLIPEVSLVAYVDRLRSQQVPA